MLTDADKLAQEIRVWLHSVANRRIKTNNLPLEASCRRRISMRQEPMWHEYKRWTEV